MTDSPRVDQRSERLRRWLRKFDPARFGLLGLLAIPGHLFESLAFMQIFGLFFLFFLWPFVEPIFDRLLARRADERTEPTDWIYMGDWREWAVAYLMIPVTFLNPLAIAQDVLQLLGSGVAYLRHRGSPPAPEDYDSQATYRLPVEGTWTVVNGSLEKEYSHSWLPTNQRYAYDFVITDEEGRSRPEGASPAVEEYYCHDEPVLAPADGVVVDVLDTDLEPARGGGFSHPLKRDIRGNYVTIQHAPGEFSCLAHLRPDSVAVEPGERVERGQAVGRCGHTGNSSEPHLHFQLQDHPTFELAAGLPVRFAGVDRESPWLADDESDADGSLRSSDDEGDGEVGITAGQRVTAVDAPTPSGDDPPPMTGRGHVATLERLAFGVAVGGVLAVVASIVVGPLAVAPALVAATFAGAGPWLLASRDDRAFRPGGVGVLLGLALVATLWIGLPDLHSPEAIFLWGVAVYVLVGEYDRLELSRRFDAGRRSESGIEGTARS